MGLKTFQVRVRGRKNFKTVMAHSKEEAALKGAHPKAGLTKTLDNVITGASKFSKGLYGVEFKTKKQSKGR